MENNDLIKQIQQRLIDYPLLGVPLDKQLLEAAVEALSRLDEEYKNAHREGYDEGYGEGYDAGLEDA